MLYRDCGRYDLLNRLYQVLFSAFSLSLVRFVMLMSCGRLEASGTRHSKLQKLAIVFT